MTDPIFFYEKKYYFLSNFAAFAVEWKGQLYMTSEHIYQSEKFSDPEMRELIRNARSAHDALRISHEHKQYHRKDWSSVKLSIMKEILTAKAQQHPYIARMLHESGDATLIEQSPVDDYWGWGPNKDGANHLGKLWMEVRSEL